MFIIVGFLEHAFQWIRGLDQSEMFQKQDMEFWKYLGFL